MTEHHPDGPSVTYYRSLCAGYDPSEAGRDAEFGVEMHERVNTGDLRGLSVFDAEALQNAINNAETLAFDTLGTNPESCFEKRVSMKTDMDVEFCFGTLDRGYWKGDTGLVLDFKFGRKPIKSLIQPRLYALGLAQELGLKRMYAAIIQPYVSRECPEVVEVDLSVIYKLWLAIKVRAYSQTMVLNPGDPQCLYCRNAATCPALGRHYGAALNTIKLSSEDGEVAARELGMMGLVERRVKARRQWIKEEMEEGLYVPGYELREQQGNARIVDTDALWLAVKDHVPVKEWSKATKTSLSEVAKVWIHGYAQAEKIPLREAEEVFGMITHGAVEREPPRKVLRKAKNEEREE